MINCDIEFKKDGLLKAVPTEIKKLIVDDICNRLKFIQPAMSEYPDGQILASYDGKDLVLKVTGYSAHVACLIEEAIMHPEFSRKNFEIGWSMN